MNERLNLARKYRPQDLSHVQGQALAVKILSEAIKQDRIGPAYVFSGPRGSGKTTCARIFGRAASCLSEKPAARPCGKCDSCTRLAAGSSMDLLEIDGASHTSVDDVRGLIEKVAYRPSLGKRSIFIIDEVHMLSNAAFNALLKTLEEPPPHVLFLFATTEQEKIPETILSRCQRIQLKRLSEVEIIKNLTHICGLEKIEANHASLEKIAAAADGSLRDAQTLLEQTILLSGGKTLSDEVTETFLGTIGTEQELKLLQAIAHQDIEALLKKSREFADQGKDLSLLSQRLLGWLRALLVIKSLAAPQSLHGGNHKLPETIHDVLDAEFHSEHLQALAKIFEEWGLEDVDRLYEVIWNGFERVKKSELPHASFSITLMRASRIPRTEDLRFLVERLKSQTPDDSASRSMSSSARSSARPAESPSRPAEPPSFAPQKPARPADARLPDTTSAPVSAGDLPALMSAVSKKRPTLYALLISKTDAKWVKNEVSFEFPKAHFAFKQLSEKILLKEFQNLVREITGNAEIEIKIKEASPSTNASEPTATGLAKTTKPKHRSFFSQAKKLATEDPDVLEAQRILGGRIESITIEGVKSPVASIDSRPAS